MWCVKLDDPKGLLGGGGNQFRSLRVPEIDKFPRVDVKKLLKQAFENSLAGLNGRPQTPNGQTIVKSISEKKRRPGMPKRAPAARRARHANTDFVLAGLKKTKSFDAYESRPPYQQND